MDKKMTDFISQQLMAASMDPGWQVYAAIRNLERLQQVAAVGLKAIQRELSKSPELGSHDPKTASLNDDLGAELSTIHSLCCMAMNAAGYMGNDLANRAESWEERHNEGLGESLANLLARNMDLIDDAASAIAIRDADEDSATEAMRWKLNDLMANEPERGPGPGR